MTLAEMLMADPQGAQQPQQQPAGGMSPEDMMRLQQMMADPRMMQMLMQGGQQPGVQGMNSPSPGMVGMPY